jgi:hypothetical protein
MAAPLSSKLPWELMNPLLAQAVNPLLQLPILQGKALNAVVLKDGTITVSHGLGRQMTGFIQTDINANVQYWRSAPFNSTTLTLTANGSGILNLWIY